MKNVRIWFKKDNEIRFISHLDLMRVMSRTIKLAKLPVWYTQGFNPHPFLVFPLPLSLGFRGPRECMDLKLESESEIDKEQIINSLNKFSPRGLEFFDITEPIMKSGSISYAEFEIKLESEKISPLEIKNSLVDFISMENIVVSKKTKTSVKDIDVKSYIISYNINITTDDVVLNIILPAGSNINVNPILLIDAFKNKYNIHLFYDITRLRLMNKDMETFI